MDLHDKLLAYYKIDDSAYNELVKDVNLSNFNDGHEFNNNDEAVSLVKSIMNKKGKIIIYGDYDADGIMGVSILKKMFDYLSYPVDYYVPSRYIDGYGINQIKAKEYVQNKYDLVITVDNGITALEPIKILKDNGVSVLVIDHHTIGEELPNADVILHHVYSKLGDVATSGAFSAFMFSRGLLGKADKYLATLASISLISDMMPMKGYNRHLLRAIKQTYVKGEFLALSLLADEDPFNENTIGMKIAPRINAIGRMVTDTSINKIIEYFTSNDSNFILNYFSYISDTNEQRKILSKEYSDLITENDVRESIVVELDIKEGLIGLVANSLLNKYHVPVIIFTQVEGKDELKGSCRSLEGFNVVEAFNSLNKYMLTSGGHALAGGCSILKSDFINFKEDFNNLVKKADLSPKEEYYIPLRLCEVCKHSYDQIEEFSPFGEEWPRPIFELEKIKTAALAFSKNGEHIISPISPSAKLIGFNLSKTVVQSFPFINVIGTLKVSSYKGFITTEFDIKQIK